MNSKQKRAEKKAKELSAAQEKAKTLANGTESTEPKKEEPKAKTAKAPKVKEDKTLTAQNAASVAKKITDQKDLKYIYPEDCDTLAKRKTFRAECRRKLGAFEKQIAKLQASELKEDQKLLKEVIKTANIFQKAHYHTI